MFFSPKTSADGLVFHYDTGNTTRSYIGEPTTNLLPEGVAATHDAASGNAVTVTDAANEKGPGWKKVTITTRGSNYRTLQWTYLTMTANITYCHSVVFDWGNMKGKNYFIYFDGDGTGVRTYYRPGNYSTAGSELIDNSMPNGKFAGVISHTSDHTHAFFIGNYTTNVGSLNDFFYYKEFQIEAKTHPTPFTTGTRSATQGLKDLTAINTINLSNSSFNSSAEIIFDGTDDYINLTSFNPTFPAGITMECVAKWTTNPGGSWQRLFDFGNGAGIDNLLFCRYSSEDRLFFGVYNGGSTSYVYSNVGAIRFGVYAFYTAVADGTNFKIYINGVQIYSEANSTVPITVARANSYLGKSNWPDSYFNGEIPVAKIYNRALTADEVARNFNAVKSRFNIA